MEQKVKRSEIVDIIFEFMRDPELIHSYETGDEIGIRHMASVCLQHIEEAGMLPPKSLQTVCLKKGLVRGYTLMFEWEPEDEEK